MDDTTTTDFLNRVCADPLGPPGPMLGYGRRLNLDFHSDPNLQKDLEDVVAKIPAATQGQDSCQFGFAVVDLTDDSDLHGYGSTQPAYAGWNDTRQLEVDSLAKLLALYGAYQLRADLRWLSATLNISDLAKLASVARKRYDGLNISSELSGLPRIEKLFTLGSPGDVNFTKSVLDDSYLCVEHALDLANGREESQAAIRSLSPSVLSGHNVKDDQIWARHDRTTYQRDGKPYASKLNDLTVLDEELSDTPQEHKFPAREQLRLMVGWSDNVAASIIIRALGFSFLWALALRTGLYRSKWPSITQNKTEGSGPGGFLISGDFNYGASKVPALKNLLPGRHGANARSIAGLMSLLAREDSPIDEESRFGMRQMLCNVAHLFSNSSEDAVPWRGEGSPIAKGVGQAYGESPGQFRKVYQIHWDEDAKATAEDGKETGQGPWNELKDQRKKDIQEHLASSKIGFLGKRMSNALLLRIPRSRSGNSLPITAVLVAIASASDRQALRAVLEIFGKEMATKLNDRHRVT